MNCLMTLTKFSLSMLILAASLASSVTAQAQIKNESSVLAGHLTRAGNKGMKELNDAQLRDLCEQGYSNAYFMYAGARARTISCSTGAITYKSLGLKSAKQIIAQVGSNIQDGRRTFVHCYNGAHASGLVAALALRQYCGYSEDQAFNYWNSKLGGYPLQPANVRAVRATLRNFVPDASLELSSEAQATLCR